MKDKKTLGISSASFVAWSRISDLADGIRHQYEIPDGDVQMCKKWAKEIILQCEIIQRIGEEEA